MRIHITRQMLVGHDKDSVIEIEDGYGRALIDSGIGEATTEDVRPAPTKEAAIEHDRENMPLFHSSSESSESSSSESF